MNWLTRLIERPKQAKPKDSPEGLWVKCPTCSHAIYHKELLRSQMVCPKCGHHSRIGAGQRAELLFWANLGAKVSHRNPHWRTLVFLHRLGDKEAWAELKRQEAELEKIGSRILAFQEAKAKNPTWKNQVNAEIASEELYGTPRSSRTILDACRRFDPGLLADSKISHK